MNLLDYENGDYSKGSIAEAKANLIKQLRYNRSSVTIEQFKANLAELQKIELELQRFDAKMGIEKINYISVIIDELEKEDAMVEMLEKCFDFQSAQNQVSQNRNDVNIEELVRNRFKVFLELSIDAIASNKVLFEFILKKETGENVRLKEVFNSQYSKAFEEERKKIIEQLK